MSAGWLPAKMLQAGMTLVNRDNEQTLKVVSQAKLDKIDTVYNFEVDEFHTYHIGEFGVWVHNSCSVHIQNLRSYVSRNGKLHKGGNQLEREVLSIGYNKQELLETKAILERSIAARKADKSKYPQLDSGHRERLNIEQNLLNRVNKMLQEF